jgi:hypothetical protein
MTRYEVWHWRVFNVFLRAFGLMALLAGMVFTLWGAVLLSRRQATVEWEGMLTSATGPKLLILLVGLSTLALAIALLRARPFRPDLGDVSWLLDPFGAKAQRRSLPRRSWWTGDRLPSSREADA